MRPRDSASRPAHIKWPLDSDPGRAQIRWRSRGTGPGRKLLRDCAERSRVASERWGVQLLAERQRWPALRRSAVGRYYPLQSCAARLSATCGNQTGQPRQRGYQNRDGAPPPEQALAAEPFFIPSVLHWRWRPLSPAPAAGTHCALAECCVGTTTERGSCDLGALAIAWVRKLGAT